MYDDDSCCLSFFLFLGLQIAQNRSYLHTLGPKVGLVYILGAIGFGLGLENRHVSTFWPFCGPEVRALNARCDGSGEGTRAVCAFPPVEAGEGAVLQPGARCNAAWVEKTVDKQIRCIYIYTHVQLYISVCVQ